MQRRAQSPPSPQARRVGRLNSISGVRRELARVYKDARRGAVSTADASRLGNLLAILARLIEKLQAAKFPASLPVYTHVFIELEQDELNVNHELRLIATSNEARVFESMPVSFTAVTDRHRVRVRGLELPTPGRYEVRVEWKRSDDGTPLWRSNSDG